MRQGLKALLAAALTFLSGTANADALVLQRTGAWDLVYDDKHCDLSAVFGDGDQRTVLSFSRKFPTESFSIRLFGPQLPTAELAKNPVGTVVSVKNLGRESHKLCMVWRVGFLAC